MAMNILKEQRQHQLLWNLNGLKEQLWIFRIECNETMSNYENKLIDNIEMIFINKKSDYYVILGCALQEFECITKHVNLYKAIFGKNECKMIEAIYKSTMEEDIDCGLQMKSQQELFRKKEKFILKQLKEKKKPALRRFWPELQKSGFNGLDPAWMNFEESLPAQTRVRVLVQAG
ncbi:hypothetical protein C1646_663913 [Rhizophagus diaphanus]|nr:hypothetical protein C1646_663913 [Rhizophagus diaphanus] [Rhizophagus sp. MUCL 43196]